MHIPLTTYGAREIAVGGLLCVALALACLWLWAPLAVVPAVAWLALLAFFRDPQRNPPSGHDLVLSPADGTVWDVQEAAPPGDFLPGRATRIGIFMSILNVHVNRSPARGTVRFVERHPGGHVDARDPEAAIRNENVLMGLQLDDGRRLLVRQVAGLVARRVVCAAEQGQRLEAGQRFGMIKFGSRVELFLPLEHETNVTVCPGQSVRAGTDVVARYRKAPRGAPENRPALRGPAPGPGSEEMSEGHSNHDR